MALGSPILGGEAQLACEDALLDPSGAVRCPGTDQNPGPSELRPMDR